MATFNAISSDSFESTSKPRKNKGQFSNCQPGVGYFMKEGVDYKPDDSNIEGIVKLSSVRTSLSNHARVLSSTLKKKMTVSIKFGTDKETGSKGLRFEFTPKNKGETPSNPPTQEQQTSTETTESSEQTSST